MPLFHLEQSACSFLFCNVDNGAHVKHPSMSLDFCCFWHGYLCVADCLQLFTMFSVLLYACVFGCLICAHASLDKHALPLGSAAQGTLGNLITIHIVLVKVKHTTFVILLLIKVILLIKGEWSCYHNGCFYFR